MTITNQTPLDLVFHLSTEDVVIQDGKRSYSPAGQIPNGIASASVAAPASVTVKAGEKASVQVTFTLPPETGQRAVVTFFRGVSPIRADGTTGMSASLGTLVTFTLTTDWNIDIGPVQATPPTPTANMVLTQELRNIGKEPVLPKGVVVILTASGKRAAKASFDPQRLLPGERLTFSATNPAKLPAGRYRTLSSFEFEGKVQTNAGEFTIPE
jgi:hypothetical protein